MDLLICEIPILDCLFDSSLKQWKEYCDLAVVLSRDRREWWGGQQLVTVVKCLLEMLSDKKCSLASDTSDPSDDVSNNHQSGHNDWTLVKYRGGTDRWQGGRGVIHSDKYEELWMVDNAFSLLQRKVDSIKILKIIFKYFLLHKFTFLKFCDRK